MTVQVAPTQLMGNALIADLRAVSGGTRVYDTVTYGQVSYPYLVVHFLPGTLAGPPLLGDGEDYTQQPQIDAVGQRRDQVQALADRARQWLLTVPLLVDDWTCARRETQMIGQAIAEGQPGRELFTVSSRYGLTWTPSA